jgi:hypothetical protein
MACDKVLLRPLPKNGRLQRQRQLDGVKIYRFELLSRPAAYRPGRTP